MDEIFEPPTTKSGRSRRRRKLIGLAIVVVFVAVGMVLATRELVHNCWSPGSWLPASGVYPGLRQSRVIGLVSCGNACRLALCEASW